MRDEGREQRRARVARLIAGLLTHQGSDQLANFSSLVALRAAAPIRVGGSLVGVVPGQVPETTEHVARAGGGW